MLRRILFFLVTIWLIVSLSFVLIYALPGDPARVVLGPRASAESIARFRVESALDESVLRRYGKFLARAASLEFGDSLVQRRPVAKLIRERAPITLALVLAAALLAALVGLALPALLLAVPKPGLFVILRRILSSLALAPPYVLAVTVVAVFAGLLGWIPAVFDSQNPLCWPLPTLVLAAYPCAMLLKLLETESHSLRSASFVLRARAYGFSYSTVYFSEILPLAALAPLAAFANSLAFFITGTFFAEAVFNIPGLGSLGYEAIRNKDVPVLVAVCLVYATAVSFVSAVLDIVLRLVDPRVRSGHGA